MKASLVKFDEDGAQCKRDIEYLRRHPNCGLPFIQDKPFQPDNPKPKFRQLDRNFSIDILDRTIPIDPDIPDAPPIGKPPKMGEAVGPSPYTNQYLPQDYTNYQQGGRRPIGEYLEYRKLGGYETLPIANAETDIPFSVPRIGNDSFSHQTPERLTRPIGGVELEDFGAGVGIPNERPPPTLRTERINLRPPRATLPDERNVEIPTPRGMTDEELLDVQIEQLTRNSTQEDARLIESQIRTQSRRIRLPTRRVPVPEIEGTELIAIEPEKEEVLIVREAVRFTRAGRPKISQREAEQIVDEFSKKGISRSRTLQILEEFNLYDTQGEFELQGLADPGERAMIRRMRAQRLMTPERDTNLLPERQQDIELREDTPLTRGRTDIATGRSRVEKVYDRVAGKLPEELRTLAGSVKRNATEFNQNVRTKSLEAIQNVSSRTTRIFGQRYTSIAEEAGQIRGLRGIGTELGTITAPEGNINIQQPATQDITGIRPNDLEAVDFDPLGTDYQDTFIGGARPKLTYAERLQRVRTGALSTESGVAAGGAVGGVLIGFGVGELMKNAGVHNQYAIAAGAGGAGGAGARIITMAGSRALTRSAATTVTETATYTAIRGGTSLLRGAAEGAVVGLALMPVDMLLNDAFVNSGMNHVQSNLSSGLIVGATGTAITTIGLASLGAAPETLGASLLVGAAAMAVTAIVGAFSGADQDRKEKEAKEKAERARNELNSTALARQKLLKTLPSYNYDFDKAVNAFANKNALGMDNDTWKAFSGSSGNMFNPKPNNTPHQTPTSGEPPTGEQKRINDLFSKYITHQLINRVCSGGGGCKELRTHDQGALTSDELKFLNDKTGSTWQSQANMQVEMSVQELNYTRQRIGAAQLQMLNAWNNEGKVANQLDPYLVQTAQLDSGFRQKYDLALKLDAQQQIVDAYQSNQTKMEQLPKNVRDMANLDPEFDALIHSYYNTMETTSGQLQISIPQLIKLQGLTGEAQKDKYQEFQFDNIKQDPVVVNEAQEISKEEDQVRAAGFYDIDQALLETDPTSISTWHPTDSQILQAHSAGMNLNEYVEYMHQLAMGETGDYSKLPKYTDKELEASGLLDYSHLQDELDMAGYRKDLYLYDSKTRIFTLNPNVTNSAIPSTQNTFISKYTPRYLLQAREEYADMVHGLNDKNQSEVDNYNTNLMRELSSYGRHYDSIVAGINNERLYQGRSDLLYYNINNIYNQNKIEFTPLSSKLSNAPTTSNISSQAQIGRGLNEQESVKTEYALNDSQYKDVKLDLQQNNIVDATSQQINQAVENVTGES